MPLPLRIYLYLVCILSLFVLTVIIFNRPPPAEYIPEYQVWQYIEQARQNTPFPSSFLYSIAYAESSLNAKASTYYARGIMQISKPAWHSVTEQSYRQAWHWQTNIDMAIAYLQYLESYLQKKKQPSTLPLLAACYHYGPSRMYNRQFKISQLPPTKNRIYQGIFQGKYITPASSPEVIPF